MFSESSAEFSNSVDEKTSDCALQEMNDNVRRRRQLALMDQYHLFVPKQTKTTGPKPNKLASANLAMYTNPFTITGIKSSISTGVTDDQFCMSTGQQTVL